MLGISIRADRVRGDLGTLVHDLYLALKAGFRAVELPAHGLGVIAGGRLLGDRLREVRRILRDFEFRLTLHGPDVLDLTDPLRPKRQHYLFLATLELAFELGAELVVYHHGAYQESRAREVEELARFGELVSPLGIAIGVENTYFPVEEVVRLVERVAHPAVGIAYDFGHAELSSRPRGCPQRGGLEAALPHLVHVHIHDNFGAGDISPRDPLRAQPLGEGDLHLPPGWGVIPFRELLPLLHGWERGIHVIELHRLYFDLPTLTVARREAEELLAAREAVPT
ncbi:sugar phosphate isomerase/epimerase family protein [Candidatus Bipolaricaulota sp. J31]